MLLEQVIKNMETEAEQLECVSEHGSPLSSMAEDVADGHTAKVLRKYIKQLKSVEV